MHKLFSLSQLFIIFLGMAWCCDSCSGQEKKYSAREINQFFYQLEKRFDKEQDARIILIKHQFKIPKNPKKHERHRERENELTKKAAEIDKSNIEWLKKTIEKYSFPSFSSLGKDAAKKFSMMIVHADQDPEFQKTCLEKICNQDLEWPDSYSIMLSQRILRVSPSSLSPEERKQMLEEQDKQIARINKELQIQSDQRKQRQQFNNQK